eukprot:1729699-Amphidinium_carterae.1
MDEAQAGGIEQRIAAAMFSAAITSFRTAAPYHIKMRFRCRVSCVFCNGLSKKEKKKRPGSEHAGMKQIKTCQLHIIVHASKGFQDTPLKLHKTNRCESLHNIHASERTASNAPYKKRTSMSSWICTRMGARRLAGSRFLEAYVHQCSHMGYRY